jgi:hypothetical protein
MALGTAGAAAYRRETSPAATEEASMTTASAGDRIMVDSQKVDEPPRTGTILEIIEHDYGTSFRVAWDDGHESTFRPTAGTVHTVHPAEPKQD